MINSIKFTFYTSHRATRLSKFLESPFRDPLNIEFIVHDGAQSDTLTHLCDTHNIRLIYIDYQQLGIIKSDRNHYLSSILLRQLLDYQIDYCFCFGARILIGDILNTYRNRIINFHPSLLPSFPGLKAIDQAIAYGSLILGNTAHFIDEGTDTGPVIMQSILPKNSFHNYDSVLDLQVPMLIQIIKWLTENRIELATDREVRIRNAVYNLNTFIPNIEFDPT